MASSYPGGLDNFTNPSASDTLDSTTVPHADQHSNANDAIEAIESTLGVNPQGSSATVVARFNSLDTKLSNLGIINVKDYGAKGDGTTDDTTAIQNALNAAVQGQTVFLPFGQYRISAPLVLPINVGLEGEHSSRWDYATNLSSAPTSLKLLPSFSGKAAILLKDATTLGSARNQGGQSIKNLSIDGNRYGHYINDGGTSKLDADTVPDPASNTVKITAVAAANVSTNVARLTITASNTFSVGDSVSLYGITPLGYNQTCTIETASSTQFTALVRDYGYTPSVDNDGRTTPVTFANCSNPNNYQVQLSSSSVGTVNIGDKISGTGIAAGAVVTLMDTINNLLYVSPGNTGTVSGTVTVTPVPVWAVAKKNAIHGIYSYGNLSSVRLQDVTVSWCTGDGIRIEPYYSSGTNNRFALGWDFAHVMSHGNKGNGFYVHTLTDSTFVDCLAGANYLDGYFFGGISNDILVGCRAEFNFGAGLHITGNLGSHAIVSGFSTDGNYSHGIYVDNIGDVRPLNIVGSNLGRDGINVNNTDPKAGLRIKRGTAPINISGFAVSADYSTDTTSNSHDACPAYGMRVSGTTANIVQVNDSVLVGSTLGYINDNSSTAISIGGAVQVASTGGVESNTPSTYSLLNPAAQLGSANTFTTGPQTFKPGADANKGLVIQRNSTVTTGANLFSVVASDGTTELARIRPSGQLGVGSLLTNTSLGLDHTYTGENRFIVMKQAASIPLGTNAIELQPNGSTTPIFKVDSTGAITAPRFTGAVTGDVTGNVSGSSGSTTGNAATATVLQTARTINGTSFNGSANILIDIDGGSA